MDQLTKVTQCLEFENNQFDFSSNLNPRQSGKILNRIEINDLYLACELSFAAMVELEFSRYNHSVYQLTPELLAIHSGIAMENGEIKITVPQKYFSYLQTIALDVFGTLKIYTLDECSIRMVNFPNNNTVTLILELPRNTHVFAIQRFFALFID